MSYPYDPEIRDYVTRLLLGAVPAYLREADTSPAGRGELSQLLRVLAAPLAIARQSIAELHADLFIDSADDWVLRRLAEMVGTTLLFPDADSNRRDIRSTVAFRRRKGTPLMLQDMGETLTGQMVVTQEGWRLVQMTQDLNLLRPERLIPDIREAILAETESGPLCATAHLPDLRSISATTGIFHPRHVAHWAHPTLLFPLDEGYPFDLRNPATDPDLRYSFHPLGIFAPEGSLLPLRARRTSTADRSIKTDRIPPMHFDQTPGVWFDQPGGFSVRIGGVAAALAAPVEEPRIVSNRLAGPELMDGTVSLALLEHDPRRFQGPVRLEVAMVDLLAGGIPDTANPAAVDVRARFDLSAAGATAPVVVNAGAVDPARVPMLRLRPVGAAAPYFPGAVIEIAGDTAGAVLAAEDAQIARQGYLRGALAVRVPATPVEGNRWFYLSLDGSCFEAQATPAAQAAGTADVAVTDEGGGVRTVPRDRLLAQSPGPAWPPLPPRSVPEPLLRVPNAPGRGPLVLHGGRVLIPAGAGFTDIGAGEDCALVFALRTGVVVPEYHPFLRLEWTGPDPAVASWTLLDDTGATAAHPDARLETIAQLRRDRVDEARLLVRFECARADARMAPAEAAWSGYDGESVLVYLPESAVQAANPLPAWTSGAGMAGVGAALAVAADGSTWDEPMGAAARQSLGDVAPLAEYLPVRRRIVRGRRLCAWINEVPPAQMLEETPVGRLDVDVEHGLFSLSAAEAVRPFPPGPGGAPVPASLTVAYQEGYTDRTGARPDAREPLTNTRLEEPTRIVSASGRLHRNAPPERFALPRYRTLAEALAAVAADATGEPEVIQFEDSATYPGENLAWPAGVGRLVIQAAERERPVIRVTGWGIDPGAAYDELVLLGLAWSADTDGDFAFPPATSYRLLYCSVLREGMTFQFDLTGAAEEDRVEVTRCLTAGLTLTGPGALRIADSVVDAGHAPGTVALAAADGEIHLDRSTVFGRAECRVVHASETLFQDPVVVSDRFHGCVRYSRVAGGSVLPRIHRVAQDVPLRFVSLNRHHPAHARLAENADPRLLTGAEDGGEIGAFHAFQLALRYEGYRRRLEESTPAGLLTGVIRSD